MSNQTAGKALVALRQTQTIILLVVFCSAATMTGSGCKNSDQRSHDASQYATLIVPADLEITIGQTGGFAGRMRGYTIAADGSLSEWEGKFPGENKRRSAQADSARAALLWRLAKEADILQTSQQAVGNMTWFVTVSAGGESRQVSWARWPEDASDQTKAQRYYESCLAAAKSALDD